MTTAYTLTPDWTATNRFDVAEASTLLLNNTCAFDIHWARTPSTAPPGNAPLASALLRPGESIRVLLAPGDSLWMAAHSGGTAVIDQFI